MLEMREFRNYARLAPVVLFWAEDIEMVQGVRGEAARTHDELTGGERAFMITYRPSVAPKILQSGGVAEKERGTLAEELAKRLLSALEQQREVDIVYGITGRGPHRDDVELTLGGGRVRAFGSQGEQRSCAVAIRIGLAQVVRRMTGERPRLLLDDVLSKLDERHRRGVFAACAESEQVIGTCCDREDIPKEARGGWAAPKGWQVFEIVEGRVA